MDSLPDFFTDINAVLKDNCQWNSGKVPDYTPINDLYYKERQVKHAPGSVGEQMTFLVKNWEKEMLHKANPMEFRTVCAEKFRLSINGKPWMSGAEVLAVGNYNAFIGVHENYNAKLLSHEQSDKLFRTVFGGGFAWEVIEVYSGPPKVALKWRHWGKMNGEYKCPVRNGEVHTWAPTNEVIEFYAVLVATLNDQYQICEMENFYDPGCLITPLTKNKINN